MENAPAGAVMTPIRLERREPAHNRQRFYTITVTRALFDNWALVREVWFETEGAVRAGIRRRQNALLATNAGAATCCIPSPRMRAI